MDHTTRFTSHCISNHCRHCTKNVVYVVISHIKVVRSAHLKQLCTFCRYFCDRLHEQRGCDQWPLPIVAQDIQEPQQQNLSQTLDTADRHQMPCTNKQTVKLRNTSLSVTISLINIQYKNTVCILEVDHLYFQHCAENY